MTDEVDVAAAPENSVMLRIIEETFEDKSVIKEDNADELVQWFHKCYENGVFDKFGIRKN